MSDFRTSLKASASDVSIGYKDQLFACGSCFAENIGRKLEAHRFDILINPFGIIYHPVPLAAMFDRIMDKRNFEQSDIFENNGLWHSWMHHGSQSNPDQDLMLEGINAALDRSHSRLKAARFLLLTFGTSNGFYHKTSGSVVANCHKMPGDIFEKRRTPLPFITKQWDTCIKKLHAFNPSLQIILTVSPVRHLRDGLVANNRSKAGLLLMAEHLEKQFDSVHYFPGYELLMDDLRDYRFFADDMSHPSGRATAYIWDFFKASFFKKQTTEYVEEAARLLKSLAHKPLFPGSEGDEAFQKQLEKSISTFKEKWGVEFSSPSSLH